MNEWFDVARTEKNGKEIWVCLEMGYTFHYRPLMEKMITIGPLPLGLHFFQTNRFIEQS